MKETIYGVISDVHQDPRIVSRTIDALKKNGAQKLLINGDIGERLVDIETSQQYTAFILNEVAKSGLESFIQPGSHETLFGYSPVIDHFSNKYPNIIDVMRNQKIDSNGHSLVFLPGSDFTCGGEYQIGNEDEIPSGRYAKLKEGLARFDNLRDYAAALQMGEAKGAFQYFNMQDLRKIVTDPDKTIMVCHVPRKFDNFDTGVDISHFWQGRVYHRNPENWDKYTYTELCIIPGKASKKEVEKNSGTKAYSIGEHDDEEIMKRTIKIMEKENDKRLQVYVERKENRGNLDLRNLYEELGIKKAVTGHFHDATHRAHDKNCVPVSQGNYVDELYWNSGHLDVGHTGILRVRDSKVSYQNIVLN